jgi:hypothetical protein
MHRSAQWLIRVVTVAACLWPLAGTTQAQGAPSARPVATVEQMRGGFNSGGYQVEPPLNWDWLVPPVSTFQVHDVLRDRVLMVLVYPSMSAAEAARAGAEARDRSASLIDSGPPAPGPHLVIGYGPSVWNANVALVQATQAQLNRIYQVQSDRDNGLYVDLDLLRESALATSAVDLDFQQALEASVANL